MKVKGLTERTLYEIASQHGFRMENVRADGRYVSFVIRMKEPVPSRAERRWLDRHDAVKLTGPEDAKYRSIARRFLYRKMGSDMRRWTGAVCFHGHKVFMDAIFERNPDAVIRSRMASYLGKADFDRKWSGMGMEQHGPAYRGTQYREACNCYGG